MWKETNRMRKKSIHERIAIRINLLYCIFIFKRIYTNRVVFGRRRDNFVCFIIFFVYDLYTKK